MQWKSVKKLEPGLFKRLVGIERETFDKMIKELKRVTTKSKHKIRGKKRGPKPKLSQENKLLMMLMYYREYRTFYHIGADYGISETQCWRIVITTETLLMSSGMFRLPGKKKLVTSDPNWEVVLIDVAEHSIERPKKNNGSITPARRKNIH